MKKLLTTILILSLFSCEPQEDICNEQCYTVIKKELGKAFYIYTLENDCTREQIIMSSVFLELNYPNIEFKQGKTICNLNIK